MRSFQVFMELAIQSTEKLNLDEVAGDPQAFKERQKAKQQHTLTTAHSKAQQYKKHNLKANKKAKKKIAARNKALRSAAGQVVSAALNLATRGASKLLSKSK